MNKKSIPEQFRLLVLQVLSLSAMSIANSASLASPYIIEQLTSNNYADMFPEINNNGAVVWSGYDGSDLEIFLYDGAMTRQLTANDFDDLKPQINNNNHVVWTGFDTAGSDREVFIYDGANTNPISDNDYGDHGPQINDKGQVVWVSGNSCIVLGCEILLFDGLTIKPITTNERSVLKPQINNSGHVVWQGGSTCVFFDLNYYGDCEIYLYNGTTIDPPPITSDLYFDWSPQINESGHVVWEKWDLPNSLLVEVFLYDGTTTKRLSINGGNKPQINDDGHTVWSGFDVDRSDREIFLYEGQTANPFAITSNNHDDLSPQINSKGHVVWTGYDDTGSDFEIYVYDGTSTNPSPITVNGHDDLNPQINNNRCVVWQGWDDNDWEIFLACPAPAIDIRRADIFEFPWWKSEEYWGGESRLTIVPPYLDIPEISPEPLPCHECSFSASWRPTNMPAQLVQLYQLRNNVIVNDNLDFRHKAFDRMIALFKTVPAGLRYSESMKESAIKELIKLKELESTRNESVAGSIARAINAIELDWRVPSIKPAKVGKVKDATIDFHGVANATITNVIKAGEVSLSIENGVPALVNGFNPGWPLASYYMEYTGTLKNHWDISIYFGGRKFGEDLSSLRLYQWDGKNYRDITTRVDLPSKFIRGRTDKLSTFVIMTREYVGKK